MLLVDGRYKTKMRYYYQHGRLSEVVGGKKRDSHSIVWALRVQRCSIGIQHSYVYIYIYIYKQSLPVGRKITEFPLFLHGTN